MYLAALSYYFCLDTQADRSKQLYYIKLYGHESKVKVYAILTSYQRKRWKVNGIELMVHKIWNYGFSNLTR